MLNVNVRWQMLKVGLQLDNSLRLTRTASRLPTEL